MFVCIVQKTLFLINNRTKTYLILKKEALISTIHLLYMNRRDKETCKCVCDAGSGWVLSDASIRSPVTNFSFIMHMNIFRIAVSDECLIWFCGCRWLGFDHILLTENNSINPIEEQIRDFINSGFVTYRTNDQEHAQLEIYSWCIRTQRNRFNWIAFFDADEFLVIRRCE